MRNCKVGLGGGGGEGGPGGGVTRFEGRVTLRREPTFLHINSLVIFAWPTRDKLTHTEHAQTLKSAKTKIADQLKSKLTVN